MIGPRLAAVAAALGFAMAAPGGSFAGEIASPWTTDKPETKARLLAGTAAGRTLAAVEITLAEGWKTYWRFPGDAGGVPPAFDWAKSDNVAGATVLFPAPHRFLDKSGDTLGYKSAVTFPVAFTPKDPAKPVTLRLKLEYGVCKDVCVPVEAELALDVPPAPTAALPAAAIAALETVPRAAEARRPGDPKLVAAEVKLDGPAPSIVVEAEFPGGAANADVFVESPSGYYIPLPKAGSAVPSGPDRLRFAIDLTGAVDPADIKGKVATVTLVSDRGQSQATFKLE